MADPPELSSSNPSLPSMTIDGSDHDLLLAKSRFLTRQELLIRRSRRIKQLRRLYRDHYWTLMKFLKHKYREYYWEFGKSPFKDDEINGANNTLNFAEETREDGNFGAKPGLVSEGLIRKCAAAGCKAKAMVLTRFCHPHILSDPKQKLYKGCTQVIKSAQSGPVLCGKPILRWTNPSLCLIHFQKNEKYVIQALKKAGLNISSASKGPPKFHIIVTEYIRQIQSKRRSLRQETVAKDDIVEEKKLLID